MPSDIFQLKPQCLASNSTSTRCAGLRSACFLLIALAASVKSYTPGMAAIKIAPGKSACKNGSEKACFLVRVSFPSRPLTLCPPEFVVPPKTAWATLQKHASVLLLLSSSCQPGLACRVKAALLHVLAITSQWPAPRAGRRDDRGKAEEQHERRERPPVRAGNYKDTVGGLPHDKR